MRRRFRLFSPLRTALSAVLLTCVCAQAQLPANTGTIVGELRVTRGSFPSMHVLVNLTSNGALAGTVYSDSEGRFSFEDLPGNVYHVVISEKGFRPADVTVMLNPSVQHVMYVRLELTPDENADAKPTGQRVQGSNPSMVDESALLSNFPKDAKKEYEKATKLQAAGKGKEAIDHYQKALGIAPTMYFARNNLGSLYLETQRFADAEAEFRKVIDQNQADGNAYFNLANVYLLTKRLGEALEFTQQGLKRQPSSAFGHFLMGSLMLQKGSHIEAEKNLRVALNENPDLVNAHLALVNLYIQQNRNADAVKELTVFLKQSPDSNFAPQARDLLKKLQSPDR